MLLPHANELYNKRLAKAGASLIIRLPFFGYLLFGSSVKVRPAPIATMSTNGVDVKCGINFVLNEDLDIVMFGLLHELLHIYFSHVGRVDGRDMRTWNIAADIYVNGQCAILLGEVVNGISHTWPVPEEFIQPQSWAHDKTVEEIYELIKKFEQQKPDFLKDLLPSKPGEIGDGTDMNAPPEPGGDTPPDPQEDVDWQRQFRDDVSHSKAMSERTLVQKPVTEAIRERMDKIMKATLPWGSLLRGSLCHDLGWDVISYCPPKIKYYPLKLILPQTKKLKERTLVLLVDVSTSVTDELIRIFGTNVQAAAYRATKIVIVTFDEVVREHYVTTNPRDIFSKVKFKSGYHTHTSAVDAFAIAEKAKPSACCCLTDGYIVLPPAPVKNTTFVIPQGGREQPWGRNYIMEHPWR